MAVPTTPRATYTVPPRQGVCVLVLVALLAGLLAGAWTPQARAQAGKPAEPEGMFVTVPSPVTEGVITQIKTKIRRTVEREGRQVRKVVFDFNPKGAPAATSDYGP